jgi:putative exosortase-associated protein (TIGR04073 family)
MGFPKRPSNALSGGRLTLVFVFSVILSAGTPVSADIQDPPMNDQGPIRKLSRGLANLLGGSTEVFVTLSARNAGEGNSAAAYHGLVDGVWRTLVRMGAGFYDVVTFPAPTMKGSYASPLPSCAPWVNNGFEEFPPELGFESRLPYSRISRSQTRVP